MQRVPAALKLGYKGPRRRFLRHICGQVQEWLKFLILFFSQSPCLFKPVSALTVHISIAVLSGTRAVSSDMCGIY